ncbi:MAG: iron ABC transporter permease [Bacillota bacterium]
MKTTKRIILQFIILIAMTIFIGLYALKTGSLEVTWSELFHGLFIEYHDTVAIIYDLRIPRIFIALLGGAALAVSGLLFQCVLKNPLADPGIIGISGGASLVATLMTILVPSMFFAIPLFAILGGIFAYFLIYTLAWKGSLEPIRIVLIGIALAAFFTGVESVFSSMGNRFGVTISTSGLAQLVWSDVHLLAGYTIIALVISLFLSPICNVMLLEDGAIRGLGVDVDKMRVLISLVAVVLSAAVTAVVGVVGFLALIVPHIGRKLVGNDYRVLLPFTMILGGFTLLFADTLGRLIMSPMEISASILMNIIGGPFFIFLLRKELSHHAN